MCTPHRENGDSLIKQPQRTARNCWAGRIAWESFGKGAPGGVLASRSPRHPRRSALHVRGVLCGLWRHSLRRSAVSSSLGLYAFRLVHPTPSHSRTLHQKGFPSQDARSSPLHRKHELVRSVKANGVRSPLAPFVWCPLDVMLALTHIIHNEQMYHLKYPFHNICPPHESAAAPSPG